MLINPYLRHIHPYYYRRIREAPFNAAVILICGLLALCILFISQIGKLCGL